jgi:AcrR family transcriptional regulator
MAHYRPHLKTAKDARAVRTREALRNAMLQLLALKPLNKVTILDICQTAGIGYTTFFRHYPTKEALLDDIAAGEIAHLIGLTVPIAVAEDIPPRELRFSTTSTNTANCGLHCSQVARKPRCGMSSSDCPEKLP